MSAPAVVPQGIEVDPPPLEPYHYGLLSAAAIVPNTDPRWQLHGVTYAADGCAVPGDAGGIWQEPCDTDAPTMSVFTVGVDKAAGGDVLTATLSALDAHYPGPVTVTVGGVTHTLAAVTGTATWTVVPGSTVNISAAIAGSGDYPPCADVVPFTVPATATDGTATLGCVVAEPQYKTIGYGLDLVEGRPFAVYETRSCLSLGFDQASVRALRRLALREQYWVESWVDSHLFRGDNTVVQVLSSGTAVPLVGAMGALEQAIAAQYGGLGVVHAPRGIATGSALLVQVARRTQGQLLTVLDNLWAFGAGYSGHGPDGTPPPAGHVWLYGTGPVVVRRSEPITNEHFDQRRNTRLAVAERVYAVTTDCLRVAVLAELPTSAVGGP